MKIRSGIVSELMKVRGSNFMTTQQPKVWFITGAGKGIGRAIAEAALAHGDFVAATTRNTAGLDYTKAYPEQALALQLDVSCNDEAVFTAAVAQAVAAFGRIDVLVNNAGFGSITNFEETNEETIRHIFEVNLFGLMRVTRAVLPIMRAQRGGHIFNIASAAGYCAGPVGYHTSKFAVTGFSVALAFETAPFGITVTNVAPGLFRTNFYDEGTWGTVPDKQIASYDAERWQTAFAEDAHKHQQPGDPAKLADLLLEVANAEKLPLHLPVGEDAVATLDDYCQKVQEDIVLWREKSAQTSF